jgi:hypothetical protein
MLRAEKKQGPVAVSIGFIYADTTILMRNYQERFLHFGRGFILLELLAALLIIVSFVIPASCVVELSVLTHFPWYLFLAGFLTELGAFLYRFYGSDNAE